MDPQHKSFQPTEFKASEATGEVEAVFTTFDIVDRDGDVVTREALAPFDGSEVDMVDSHMWSMRDWLGHGVINVGTKQARFTGRFFMESQSGRDAFLKVKERGERGQWSWSFLPGDVAYEERDGQNIRVIKSLAEAPFEVSPVLIGSNPQTRTLSVKSQIKEALADPEFITELRAGLLEALTKEPDSTPDAEPEGEKEAKPLPTPAGDEEREAFIERCMGDDVMNADFPDADQRMAVCVQRWEDSKSPASEEEAAKSLPADLRDSVESFLRHRERYRGEFA